MFSHHYFTLSNIDLFLPEDSHLKITIYDINGKSMGIVTDSNFKKGRHDIKWTKSNELQTGKYIIRVESEKYNNSHSIILLK